jgi:ketosteroid isomerase-like protein
MNMMIEKAVTKWIDALNSGDVEALVQASEPTIAITGPRGVAEGTDILRQWYDNTRLTFDLDKLLVSDNQAIALGTAHWHDEENAEVGSGSTAFLMKTSPSVRIAALARYDDGLEKALVASGISDISKWHVES